MGTCSSRQVCAVLRYYLPHDDNTELSRALCILFLPYRDEMKEIHKNKLNPEELLKKHYYIIVKNKEKYESNNPVLDIIRGIEDKLEKRNKFEN